MAEIETVYTQDQVDELVTERLASAKAEGDKAFESLWGEAKAAKEKLRAFDGVDAAEYKTLKEQLKALEQKDKADKAGITAEELAKMRAEMRADVEGEYSGLKTRAEELATENRTLKLDNVVKATMSKVGVRAERLDALYRLTKEHYDLTDDGQPLVKLRPGKEVEKYVAEDLAKEYPEFFRGSGSSGSGASRSAGGAGDHVRTIAAGDSKAFLDNLEGIAKGRVTVQD